MAKETQKEQIARLEAENERLTKNFNDCFAENQQLEKKLNARIEDTDEYKRCAQLLQKWNNRGTRLLSSVTVIMQRCSNWKLRESH